MFETTVQLKPRAQWRPGMTPDLLVEALDRAVSVPGLSKLWVPPIRNRIDLLATGIKSPVGIKVAGADPATLDRLAAQISQAVRAVPGVSSALAERLNGGRYIDVDVDRLAAARLGLSVSDVQAVVSIAIGGDNLAEVIQGRERYPINVRYPRELRDSLDRLRQLPFVTAKVAIVLAGLLPMLWGDGTGSALMARIAAPMVGGMVTAPLLSMLGVPAAWYLLHRRRRTQGCSGACGTVSVSITPPRAPGCTLP